MATTSSGADPEMLNKMGRHLKSQGIFDQFRRDCLEDVDTKPAYQNLRQKVEGYVSAFLAKVKWEPKMNKNQLRDSLRRQINQSEMLSAGVERIIEQVIEPKMQHVFRPQIEKVVDEFLDPEGNKDAESVKKDLATTSGWQGVSHQITAPTPPDLPPEVPTPAPPLPPSEPPAAPPEAPPEEPPDSPPDDLVPSTTSQQDSLKSLQVGTSPSTSSGGNTPSSTASKGHETPSLVKKHSGGLSQVTADIKTEKKPAIEPTDDVAVKSSAAPSKALIVKSEPAKNQGGKSLPGKDQGVKKVPLKDQFFRTQPSKVIKKVPSGSKLADSVKAVEKPKIGPTSKHVILKTKTLAEAKGDDDVLVFQTEVKKSPQDSEVKPQISELVTDKKPIPQQPSSLRVASESVRFDTESDLAMDTDPPKSQSKSAQELKEEKRSSISPLPTPDVPASSKSDTEADPSMDVEIADGENEEMASRGDDSDGESGLSDISVSSVHTSDLSSFDEDISSTSSSSSSDSSSEEETKPQHVSPKRKKPTVYTSDSDSEVPSEVTISTDTSRPASVASDKPSIRRSPKMQGPSARALAISRYHGDSEDEDSRQERRKKAALAKEERARRRQLAKEEREKVIVEKREKRALDSETTDESGEAKKAPRREEAATASPLKATKEQLKEQKMLEKKREVRRRRSLNKRYFSDEFSSSMQGMKETVSQQEDDEEVQPEQVKQPEFISWGALIHKEKCFHLVYRERREPQVRCHHLLNQGLSGEQQKKLSTRKRKERRDSKVSRFSFAQAKAMTASSREKGSKQSSSSQSRKEQNVPEQQQDREQLQQHDREQPEQLKDVKEEHLVEKDAEQPSRDKEFNTQQGDPTLPQNPKATQEPSEEPESIDVLPSERNQNPPSLEEQGEEAMEEEIKIEEEVGSAEEQEGSQEEQLQEADEPEQDFGMDTQQAGEDREETKESLEEKQEQSEPAGEEIQICRQGGLPEAAMHPEETKVPEIADKDVPHVEEDENQEELQENETGTENPEGQILGPRASQETVILSPENTATTEEIAAPQQTMEAEDPVSMVPAVPMETTGDDMDNPPTPTQDEPSIYSDADSESEEHSDKGSSIPIYTVHSPKHLPLGSVFKLSQTSLQDVSGGRAETRTLSKDSDASAPDDTGDSDKACPQEGTGYQREDSRDSNTDSDKQVTGEKASPQDKPSASESAEPTQPESRYGTRPKRHTTSPRDSLDDDYYYYGQPKRGRYSQSPISHQEESEKAGRSRSRRVSTDSGKSEGTSREAADRPTRTSRQRHVSPPHRYSPSDNRVSYRRSSTSSPHPPAVPPAPAKQTRRGSSPSSHEHFTRRSSGRDEAKRGNRYSDMYYYNDRGSRSQASTRGGDRGRAPEPVSSRRSSRRSVEDRAGNQASTKRRK